MSMLSKWVLYAAILAGLLIVLSRSTAFSTAFTALTKGTNTIGRTILGENTAGTSFIAPA